MMLAGLKNYLDITWDDPAIDSKLSGILERAKSVLQSYAGASLSFEDNAEKQLLLDCCRYIYNNAYEEFKINFHSELIMLRAKYAVEAVNEDEG